MFRYVYARYYEELTEEYPTLDEALQAAWRNTEYETGYPLDIYEDGTLLFTNRGAVPWSDTNRGTLNERLFQYQQEHDL